MGVTRHPKPETGLKCTIGGGTRHNNTRFYGGFNGGWLGWVLFVSDLLTVDTTPLPLSRWPVQNVDQPSQASFLNLKEHLPRFFFISEIL